MKLCLGCRTIALFILLTTSPRGICASSFLNVTVDPRIELLTAVEVLGFKHPGLNTPHDVPYKQEVLGYFAPHENHSAVEIFREITSKGIWPDAYAPAMIRLSNPPDLEIQHPFNDYIRMGFGGEEKVLQFVEALREFVPAAGFMKFFENNRKFYADVIRDVQEQLGSHDYIADLEYYYGTKQNSYNIILSPLLHHGGFGPRLKHNEDSYDVYNIIGPTGVEEGMPVFGPERRLKDIATHEFGHSFVNPLTAKHIEKISKYAALYDPIADKMKKRGYSSWEICVNEHIIRAVTTRFTYRELGEHEGDETLKREKSRGFAYIEGLCQRLGEYELQRDKYKTFEEFYPQIIRVFEEESQ